MKIRMRCVAGQELVSPEPKHRGYKYQFKMVDQPIGVPGDVWHDGSFFVCVPTGDKTYQLGGEYDFCVTKEAEVVR